MFDRADGLRAGSRFRRGLQKRNGFAFAVPQIRRAGRYAERLPNPVSCATSKRTPTGTARRVTFIQLAGPIAAATAVNVVLLGLAWKATQVEKREGRPRWYWEAGLVAYIAACGLILYLLLHQIITHPVEVFAGALVGETLGAAMIWGLFHAIYRKDRQPTGQRIFEIGMSVFILAVIFGSLFA